MRVVLAGASGLIGSALTTALRAAGHDITTLVRHDTDKPGEDRWDPAQGLLDPQALAGADAVVCLSGVGVGDKRWTEDYKRQIVSSRVDTVGTIARTLAGHGGPRTFIAASAVGYYGDTGDTELDEQAPQGASFLAEVCHKWEAAAQPAVDTGVRVTHIRTGLVLAADGGLLKQVRPLVKLGVFGKLGDGKQYMPWISLTDEVAAIQFLLDHPLTGPVNLTGPAPVTNARFTKAVGSALHRPTVLPVPGFAAHIALGEFAGEVLGGQRAMPVALLDAGFRFTHGTIDDALRAELN